MTKPKAAVPPTPQTPQIWNDNFASLLCAVQPQFCCGRLVTNAADVERFHRQKMLEPVAHTMSSTILVLPCTERPVVLGPGNRLPLVTQFSNREVVDPGIAALTDFLFPGFATASVRLFGPQQRDRRVWRGAIRYVVAFCRAMRRIWPGGGRRRRREARKRQ